MESLQTLVERPRARVLDHPGPADGATGWGDPPGGQSLVLGRYRLLERLGTGGFGVVWRARDELLHREVAVKRVPLAPDKEIERASREALAAARLAHPAIVALYEACAADDAFYLITELVHGETLGQLIAKRALSDEDILAIGIALSDALAHAHSRGVIHRDVKPQNVLVPRREQGAPADESVGVAKLTDFGGARLAGEDLLTRTGDVLGTLAYMAPEQSEGREVSEATDLYALALVLYEALSGFNPVRGSTPAATARRIGRPLAPLERTRGDLPRALTRALDRALAPSPGQRITLEELRLALEEALAHGLGGLPRRPRPRLRRETPFQEPAVAPRQTALEHAPERAREQRQTPPHMREILHEASGRTAATEQSGPAASFPQRLTLTRRVWLGCALAVIVWQAWAGRSGVAMLLFAAIAPLGLLLIAPAPGQQSRSSLEVDARSGRSGLAWLTAALAPLLGLAGLAGAYPAIAGQARRWQRRAALGALGYWWLTLAGPLADSRSAGRGLWLGQLPGTPARSAWEGSLSSATVHVIGPMLSLAVLLGAALWAVGSLLLPWLVRGRSAALDVVAVATWSAVIVAAAPALDAGLSGHLHASPRGAVLGGVLGGAFAVIARALRGPV